VRSRTSCQARLSFTQVTGSYTSKVIRHGQKVERVVANSSVFGLIVSERGACLTIARHLNVRNAGCTICAKQMKDTKAGSSSNRAIFQCRVPFWYPGVDKRLCVVHLVTFQGLLKVESYNKEVDAWKMLTLPSVRSSLFATAR
jgi:hypothetical protein